MRIVFSYLPFAVLYNHGVALLTSICRAAGIHAYIVPMTTPETYRDALARIEPDFVGFSFVTEVDYHASGSFVQEARTLGVPLLAGGVYVRRMWQDVRACGMFDFVCPGEAEILPGFLLEGNMAMWESPYYQVDLSLLPLPDYSMVNGFEFHRGYEFLKSMKIIPYSSSRGCPYRCSFCAVRHQPKGVRVKQTVREDLELLYEQHRPDLFCIMDELLPYYLDDWKAQFDGNRIPFMCYIRADIEPADLLFLHRNGLRYCAFGVESGDETYRNDVLAKDLTDKEIWRTVHILNDLGITYMPFFMMGTPGETEEIQKRTLAMRDQIGGHPTVWEYQPLEKEA